MNYSKKQQTALVLLRILVGWHFLYEALIKVFTPNWSSVGYLKSAQILKGFFGWLASPSMIQVVDMLTMVSLLVIGLSLTLGLFTRLGALLGILILAMFYLAQPALPGLEPSGPTEGNYLIVTKNLIEIAALLVLRHFPTGEWVGLDMYLKRRNTTETAN